MDFPVLRASIHDPSQSLSPPNPPLFPAHDPQVHRIINRRSTKTTRRIFSVVLSNRLTNTRNSKREAGKTPVQKKIRERFQKDLDEIGR